MPQLFQLKCARNLVMAVLAVAGIALFQPKAVPAQTSQAGTVSGQVTDAQGAAMVGAVVTLTNNATNDTHATIANSAGRYVFANVNPGTYTLDVKKEGFKEAKVNNQVVDVGKELTLNIPMQVGTATQTVEVSASGAELQTMNATVGSTVGADAIIKLPNLGRDANALTLLQPNTAPGGGVAGSDQDQNTYTLDGGANSDDMDGSHDDYTPASGQLNATAIGSNPSGTMPTPADSIEQFSVATIGQTADVNGAAGSSVSMVTKRGTDQIHGSAYEYYLGSALAANNWFDNQTNTARAVNHQNRFGGSLGGEILPKFWGGKTYLFGNFEGRRYPDSEIYTKDVPSALLRAGVVQANNDVPGTNDTEQAEEAYNLNPTSVIVNGTAYAPAVCSGYGTSTAPTTGPCDPRGLGLNPVVSQMWSQYLPTENNASAGDRFNTQGYNANLGIPLQSNFAVVRLDHDFGSKNHFDMTYHFYSYNPTVAEQVDVGGGLPGDTFGDAVATTNRPQLPSMWTAQLTSSLTPNLTNNLHYSYLRNFWQWAGSDVNPQTLTGYGPLGGALEIGGESAAGSLIPYNVNTQNVRTRVWDGIGQTFGDDLTLLHGNHIFEFGGKYTDQRDFHTRNDNGGGIMAANVYQIGSGPGVANTYTPADAGPDFDNATYNNAYDEVLGIVDQPQTMYTRAGANLALQPLGTPLFDQDYIPLYNSYFSDSWHFRPNLTITYGASYTVEMPPVEAEGKQVELVDGADNAITGTDYLAETEKLALGGQAYAPELGFATVGNVGSGLKYPYNPFYGGLSPRLSAAWQPHFSGGLLGELFGSDAVIRGGWARIYGRLNGVDQVLVPLLGTGLAQPVTCIGASMTDGCLGNNGVTPANAFRIGVDGLTAPLGAAPSTDLPQPYFPGVTQNGVLNPAAGAGEVLDPDFKPDRSDEFTLTIQRQINSSFSMELGYTGRIIRNEYQPTDLVNVPYMLTAGGQQFQTAFANMFQQIASKGAITPQSFFETALGGSSSAYCKGFTSCTAAVASNEQANNDINPVQGNNIYNLWSDITGSPSWTLGPTNAENQMSGIYDNMSDGYGNYNALFYTITMRNWHNLTMLSNLTWSRAMGTGQVDQATSEYGVTDPYNLAAMYGPQYNDFPLVYNLYFVYEPGSKTQKGLMGHLLHGWSFAPIFTWNDGGWEDVNNGGDCSSFGEMNCAVGGTQELAIATTGYSGGTSVIPNTTEAAVGINGNAANGGTGMNQFGNNAQSVYNSFRPIVLGLDTTGQSGLIPGIPFWNVDFSLTKDLALSERFGTELSAQATNVFNHMDPGNPYLDINDPNDFGAIEGANSGYSPRQIELGIRIHW